MKIGFDQTSELNVRKTMVVCGSGTSEAYIDGGFMIVHPRIWQLWCETAWIAEDGVARDLYRKKSDMSGVSHLAKISSGVGGLSAVSPIVSMRFRSRAGM